MGFLSEFELAETPSGSIYDTKTGELVWPEGVSSATGP